MQAAVRPYFFVSIIDENQLGYLCFLFTYLDKYVLLVYVGPHRLLFGVRITQPFWGTVRFRLGLAAAEKFFCHSLSSPEITAGQMTSDESGFSLIFFLSYLYV